MAAICPHSGSSSDDGFDVDAGSMAPLRGGKYDHESEDEDLECASRQGRSTVGDRVQIVKTPNTRKHFRNEIGNRFTISNDDKSRKRYQVEGHEGWLYEADFEVPKAGYAIEQDELDADGFLKEPEDEQEIKCDFQDRFFLRRSYEWHHHNRIALWWHNRKHHKFGSVCDDEEFYHGGLTWALVACKWVGPMALMMTCTFLCMAMLHLGTYYYVNSMIHWEANYEVRAVPKYPPNYNNSLTFSFGLAPDDISFGSLEDPLTNNMGYATVNIKVLDKLAMVFPLIFGSLTILVDDLQCWTRIMLCNAILAIGKGLFGMLTVQPDSAGWKACRERLKPEGIAWMSEPHNYFDFLKLDWPWKSDSSEVKSMRWCADMMYSGHTYFVTLYALGLFEITRNFLRNCPTRILRLALFLVGTIAVVQQCIEIYFVLKNHFHYTSDVVMAVVLTFLLYTNGVVAQKAKWWKDLAVKYDLPCMPIDSGIQRCFFYNEVGKQTEAAVVRPWAFALDADGEVFIPICCCPDGMTSGPQYLYDHSDLHDIMQLAYVSGAAAFDKAIEAVETCHLSADFDRGATLPNHVLTLFERFKEEASKAIKEEARSSKLGGKTTTQFTKSDLLAVSNAMKMTEEPWQKFIWKAHDLHATIDVLSQQKMGRSKSQYGRSTARHVKGT